MKYEFRLNGVPCNVQELFRMDLMFVMHEDDWGTLMRGNEVELENFASEDGTDVLQLVEVE